MYYFFNQNSCVILLKIHHLKFLYLIANCISAIKQLKGLYFQKTWKIMKI